MITVLQDRLAAGLSIVQRGLPSRPIMPITSCILVRVVDGRLSLTATSIDTSIRTTVGAKIGDGGSDFAVALPGRQFSELVRALPPAPLELVPGNGDSVIIRAGKAEAKLPGFPAKDFPPFPTITDAAKFTMPPADLSAILKRVIPAAAARDDRPVLACVSVQFRDENEPASFACADGFRLARVEIPMPENAGVAFSSYLLPRSLATHFITMAPKAGNSTVFFEQRRVAVHIEAEEGDIDIVGTGVMDTFPPIQRVIPEDGGTRFTVNCDPLVREVRLAGLSAEDADAPIKLSMKDGQLFVRNRREMGKALYEGETAITEASMGEATTWLNRRYLTDMLEGCGETAEIQITAPMSPVRFTSPGFTGVIIPMDAREDAPQTGEE